ncbi:MAG: outer membrane lipoprotein-sorting protein [Elusimicrobia bacterium]|nr:outer membrane lipoprotein-sorting protein [Elusimicrobiota bacterium]
MTKTALALVLAAASVSAARAEGPAAAPTPAPAAASAPAPGSPAAPGAASQACASGDATGLSTRDIIDRANKVLRGDANHSSITMTIVTPSWKRALDIEAWNQGRDKALILIHAPAKDKGNTTLRRENEMWVWMPKVERVMKVPPTMMHSSWQGSDFTYEDIVKADSIVRDYTHKEESREKGEGYYDLKILATPKPDAPVVWGKVLFWARVYHDCGVVPVKEEDYNERGELVRTIKLSEVETIQGRRAPTFLECLPEKKPGQKTSIKYRNIQFDIDVKDSFFSLNRLQKSGS